MRLRLDFAGFSGYFIPIQINIIDWEHFMTSFLRAFALLPAVAALLLCGCGEDSAGTAADGKIAVSAGLPPIAYLANRIGGEFIHATSVLPEGRSPHDYSPGPHDIRAAAAAKLFLTTRMPFENTLLNPLSRGSVKVIDVSEGIQRIPFGASCEHEHAADPHAGHSHAPGEACSDDGLDPHVWLSLENAIRIAANIEKAYAALDPAHAAVYRANCEALTRELSALAKEVKQELAPYAGAEFYVYHPAFGYFARMTGLGQAAIELGGREASPAHLAGIIRRAREHGVRVIFVQPQFNPASARALSQAIGGKVVGMDPLAADLPANIREMTRALKAGFAAQQKTGSSDGRR